MTRKDFVLIAESFRYSLSSLDEGSVSFMVVCVAAENMANALRRSNPRFDRERFLTACGVIA
jgi:hypothetical protein